MTEPSARDRWADQVTHAMEFPRLELGPYASHTMQTDPRHLCFELARYKFCARMLEGKGRVLEVGCGDAFGMPLVAQVVGQVHGIDTEARVIDDNRRRLTFLRNVTFECRDPADGPPPGPFEAAYLLDVIEHVPPEAEDAFLENLCAALDEDGVLIVGTPNREASRFASEASRACHVNLKTAPELRAALARRFRNVFIFSMNDEVVHTGFHPMAHYLLAMGVGVRGRP